MPAVAENVIHISEAEAASDFASVMAPVRAGAEIVIDRLGLRSRRRRNHQEPQNRGIRQRGSDPRVQRNYRCRMRGTHSSANPRTDDGAGTTESR